MHMTLLEPGPLARGSELQQRAHAALGALSLFERLKVHSPVLVGSLPLDVEPSAAARIEVACSSQNLEAFAGELASELGAQSGFVVEHLLVDASPTVRARFSAHDFDFEISAQPKSVFTQTSVVCVLVSARLLTFAPPEARDEIRSRRASGSTVNEAFAQCFELTGDPTEELLKISRLPDREILGVTHRDRKSVV